MVLIGIYFQILDDYSNLNSEEVSVARSIPSHHVTPVSNGLFVAQYTRKKGECEDLDEGSFRSFSSITGTRDLAKSRSEKSYGKDVTGESSLLPRKRSSSMSSRGLE